MRVFSKTAVQAKFRAELADKKKKAPKTNTLMACFAKMKSTPAAKEEPKEPSQRSIDSLFNKSTKSPPKTQNSNSHKSEAASENSSQNPVKKKTFKLKGAAS